MPTAVQLSGKLRLTPVVGCEREAETSFLRKDPQEDVQLVLKKGYTLATSRSKRQSSLKGGFFTPPI